MYEVCAYKNPCLEINNLRLSFISFEYKYVDVKDMDIVH